MTDILDHAASVLADAVIEDGDAGVYRANRRIFTDEDIFELEMKHIFEGNWVYLAHETQVPNPGDYFTTYIGRQPVVITRDRGGKLNCLINACSHRGAMLCRRKTDNRTTLTCPFHGWTFRNDGSPAQGQGSRGRRLSGRLQPGRLTRPDQGPVRQLPWLPVRQHQ